MRCVAITLMLMLAACSASPTQPQDAAAHVVFDTSSGSISLTLCASSSWCSMSGRLRNIGAGCAQHVSATITIGAAVYRSAPTADGDIFRPNQTIQFQIAEFPNVDRASMRIEASWTDVPCGS